MDRLTKEQRSRNMSAVRGKDTKPEIYVRKALHKSGFRYTLHVKYLRGTPDLVLPKYEAVIFVHGCFWHAHNCPKGKSPSSNKDFWEQKLRDNMKRDKQNQLDLTREGWRVFVIWECALDDGIQSVRNALSPS